MRKTFIIALCASLPFVACKKDDDKDPEENNISTAPVGFPNVLSNKTINMELTTEEVDSPYSLNQKVNFSFTPNGNMKIDSDPAAANGFELNLPFDVKTKDEYWWRDMENGHSYALHLKVDSTVNEINVFDTKTTSLLGQFTPIDTSQVSDIVANYTGIYTVTNTTKGSHTRMTVRIDGEGNIDFDDSVFLLKKDFALVTDALVCCDGIWVDMMPYPSEPYERAELHMDPSTGDLMEVHYYPEYPSVSGRVFVEVTN